MKRVESVVEREKREKREEDALRRAKEEEKGRRKEGKGAWFLKKGEFALRVWSLLSLIGLWV